MKLMGMAVCLFAMTSITHADCGSNQVQGGSTQTPDAPVVVPQGYTWSNLLAGFTWSSVLSPRSRARGPMTNEAPKIEKRPSPQARHVLVACRAFLARPMNENE